MEKPEHLKAKPSPKLEYSVFSEEIEREHENLTTTRKKLEEILEYMGEAAAVSDRLRKEWGEGNLKVDDAVQKELDELGDAYKEAQQTAQSLSSKYDEIAGRLRALRVQDSREDVAVAGTFDIKDKGKMN